MAITSVQCRVLIPWYEKNGRSVAFGSIQCPYETEHPSGLCQPHRVAAAQGGQPAGDGDGGR
jgi:hypothetical protein